MIDEMWIGDTPAVAKPATKAIATEAIQLSIFETVYPAAGQIKALFKSLDLNSLTPIDCMLKLRELQRFLED
jgi:DNA mismatch repair protein MutS